MLGRQANAPIAQQRDTPNVIREIVRADVLALLAEHDRQFALVIETGGTLGIDHLPVVTDC